jgi:hypothetical protein
VKTPDEVVAEIYRVRAEIARGPEAIEKAELEAERAADVAKLAEDKALLTAEGSVPEKQAKARLASIAERDEAFIARARLNRMKLKARGLEGDAMLLQSVLKWMRGEGA